MFGDLIINVTVNIKIKADRATHALDTETQAETVHSAHIKKGHDMDFFNIFICSLTFTSFFFARKN